ncbi:MAG: HNH endonuclease [Bacteroidales bacterium]|nr:HNH endonuclease [Bacteroidales bacterium]
MISLDTYFEIKYSNRGYNNTPKSNGKWSGETGNSYWQPARNIVPERNMYSNPEGKSWGEILDFYKVKNGILFKEGEPVFDDLAWEEVVLRYEDIGRDELLRLQQNERSVLHNLAFDKLAKSKGWSLEQTYKYKEDNNLVWHEKSDCKTLLLVPRMIHDNITHYGGVSMLRCLEI